MILTPNILARLVAIVVAGVILQLSFFSQVSLFHVSPDVLPALVVVLGLLGGSLTGAVCGFSIGFLPDCLLVYGDKTSMASGLEQRVPFLDVELMSFVECELGQQVPDRLLNVKYFRTPRAIALTFAPLAA